MLSRPTLPVLLLLLLAAAAAISPPPLFAQESEKAERLPAEWILRYEQCWGVAGLYVEEPPPAASTDEAARVRKDLVALTRAARQFLAENPAVTDVTQARLLAGGYTETPFEAPEGMEYVFSPKTQRFLCTRGDAYDIVFGAMKQLQAAQVYRSRVNEGSPLLYRAWGELEKDPELPEIMRREIETRRFAIRMRESGPMKAAEKTQELLGELNAAIEMATSLGQFKPGQEITMPDVGRTGLIDLLEALPLDGKYSVTKAGEPPAALFGEVRIPYDEEYPNRRLEAEVRKYLAEHPDYPPALALLAQLQSAEDAVETLSRAIEQWPDVPALRIQRLATNARLLAMDEIPQDFEYLMYRFPATPICLEIDMATRKDVLRMPGAFRARLAATMAEVRPEVLNLQLIAFKELIASGDIEGAALVRDRLIERHPGYEPLLPDPYRLEAEAERTADQ
ncbi:MAG: hypothetical protein PWP23_1787 [Candidatus Sumerlaeota bacterium]|nr:hypothetical protein [Candidatus Sumerlaeota bacterium]